MKKVISLLSVPFVLLCGFTVHAYEAKEPYSVCTAIGQVNSSNGQACVGVVSKADRVDENGAGVCFSIVQAGGASANALTCMQYSANAYIEYHAAQVCATSAENGGASANIADCVRVIANKYFDVGATNFCLERARGGSSSSTVVTCMSEIARTTPPGGGGDGSRDCLSRAEIADELARVERILRAGNAQRGLRLVTGLRQTLDREVNCR